MTELLAMKKTKFQRCLFEENYDRSAYEKIRNMAIDQEARIVSCFRYLKIEVIKKY